MKKLKVVFFGNPDFCIPSLIKLDISTHYIVSIVTNVDRKSGRGLKFKSSPVKIKGKTLGIPIIEFNGHNWEDINKSLKQLDLDIFVVIAFSIIPEIILNIPKYGTLNIHPSLLPKYRGASPIQYALLNGDNISGISIININNKIDSGDILAQEKISIKKEYTYGYLHDKLSVIGANLLLKVIDAISQKKIKLLSQNNKNRTFAPKIKKDDLIINWKNSSINIHNQIRAFDPLPGAFCYIDKKRLKLFGSKVFKKNKQVENLNKIGDFTVSDGSFIIKCNSGFISIEYVQLEGKKKNNSVDFYNNLQNKKLYLE